MDDATSPYTPHTAESRRSMLSAVGADSLDALFDVPDDVRFEGDLGLPARSEREARAHVGELLDRTDDLTAFLGRGHYAHYVPAAVDSLASRSEFLTSYTQYQPEVAQGFLQALFEYQSMLVDLTGLPVVNCSTYDAASALGEAARMARRVDDATGSVVLVPTTLRSGTRSVLENYLAGTDARIGTYPLEDGVADVAALSERAGEDTLAIYAASPTVRGTIEPALADVCAIADEASALSIVGTDPVALGILKPPAAVGADVAVGDAASLGTGLQYGMGLGLFACRERYRRQVPGRFVGATTDASDRRAFTLTLQAREQHVRRERATSNVCTNQAWLALRTAIHLSLLGPDGLAGLANECVRWPRDLAARIDDIDGYEAPVHDRHHFREFTVATAAPAAEVRAALAEAGYAVHAVDDHELQICVTEPVLAERDDLVAAMAEVAA